MKKLSWFAFFLVFSASCLDDPDCFQLHNDILGITFRVIGTGQADSTVLKDFSTPGENAKVTSFSYQLNYFQEQDILLIKGIKQENFLSFGYAVKNQFVSEDCGSSFVLSDLYVLDHDFDSVRVVNGTPTKVGGPNIDIYRCPETDTLTLNFNQLKATSNGVLVSNKTSNFISHPFDSITSDFSGKVFSGRAATLYLPVNLSVNKTKYIFKVGDTLDSLVLIYDLKTEERYKPCGMQTFVSSLSVISHSFDSLSFGLDSDEEPVRALLDPHAVNLRIYDCPKTNLLSVLFKNSAGTASILIDSVTADHLTGDFLKEPSTVSTLTLPVDTESSFSTFYIHYENQTDTLSVQYNRAPIELFTTCGVQMIMTNLTERVDLENAVIPTSGTSLYPTVTNVEITID